MNETERFDREQRLSCIIQAVQVVRSNPTATEKEIVAMAESFYKFVEGKNETEN